MKRIRKPLCCLLALLVLSFGCAEVHPQAGLKSRLAHQLKVMYETALDRAGVAVASLDSLFCRMFAGADVDADLSDSPLFVLCAKLQEANRLSDRTVSGILPLFSQMLDDAHADADALQQKLNRCAVISGPRLRAEAEALDALFGNGSLPSEEITAELTDLTAVRYR